jgi:hypothetical protein
VGGNGEITSNHKEIGREIFGEPFKAALGRESDVGRFGDEERGRVSEEGSFFCKAGGGQEAWRKQ